MAYTTRKEAKEAGWFSRRHRTDEAHRAAVAKRNAFHGPWARKRNAEARAAIWETLTGPQKFAKQAREQRHYQQNH